MLTHGWLSPFAALEGVHRDLDRLFERIADDDGSAPGASRFPALNVSENDERITVHVELPGIDPANLDVRVRDDVLLIAGRRDRAPQEGGRVLRGERVFGAFRREIALPARVASDGIDARYKAGVLTITLQKAPEARPQVIQVQAG